jgi:hypothetical protein
MRIAAWAAVAFELRGTTPRRMTPNRNRRATHETPTLAMRRKCTDVTALARIAAVAAGRRRRPRRPGPPRQFRIRQREIRGW